MNRSGCGIIREIPQKLNSIYIMWSHATICQNVGFTLPKPPSGMHLLWRKSITPNLRGVQTARLVRRTLLRSHLRVLLLVYQQTHVEQLYTWVEPKVGSAIHSH